jgi:hypothetical protein
MVPADSDLPDVPVEPPQVEPPQVESPQVEPAPAESPARPARRTPILPIAVAMVAILAGGALFMSGYSLGAKSASQPGTPASQDGVFQPFWDAYHSIDERYAGGDIDRDALV